jgi:hypothetical protein
MISNLNLNYFSSFEFLLLKPLMDHQQASIRPPSNHQRATPDNHRAILDYHWDPSNLHRATPGPPPSNPWTTAVPPPDHWRASARPQLELKLLCCLYILYWYFMLWMRIDFYRLVWLNEEKKKNICYIHMIENAEKYFKQKTYSWKIISLKSFSDIKYFMPKQTES